MENLELLVEQANNGDAMSQYKLGRAYESGDGVEKSLTTAKIWYQKSADNGYKNAEVKLRLLSAQHETTAPKAEAPKQAYHAPSAPHFATPTGTQTNNNVSNPQHTPKSSPTQNAVGQKSKVAAALLALFLGYFGAHDFYLGYKKQGVIKIILTITIIGCFATYIWTLIDFIKILCNGKLDSNGQLLK